jgi:hypothetical protein
MHRLRRRVRHEPAYQSIRGDIEENLTALTAREDENPRVDDDALERMAQQHRFPSRQAAKPKTGRRKPRLHRTGRNVQFNAKATHDSIARFYALVPPKGTIAETLERADEALRAMKPLSELAHERNKSLQEIVTAAAANLEREESRQQRVALTRRRLAELRSESIRPRDVAPDRQDDGLGRVRLGRAARHRAQVG